jgi:hypothetical protein
MILYCKKCISRGMQVYFGLIMLAAYFCHVCKSQVEYDCASIKEDWLAACMSKWRFIVIFLRCWPTICIGFQPMGIKNTILVIER